MVFLGLLLIEIGLFVLLLVRLSVIIRNDKREKIEKVFD